MFSFLRVVGIIVSALLYAAAGMLALLLGLYLISYGCFWMPVALVIAAAVVLRLRRRRVSAILYHLTACFRLNLPLAPTLAAAAGSEGGRLRQRLGDLSQYLSSGQTLGQSLALAVPEMPARDRAVIAAAESVSRLPQAFERLLARRRTADQSEATLDGLVFAYMTLMLVGMGAVLSFLLVLIAPKFEKIFDDFGTALPPVTRHFLDVSAWLVGPLISDRADRNQIIPGVAWILVAVLVLAGILILLRNILGPDQSGWAVMRWNIWPWRSIERGRGLSDVCAMLAESLEAGLPVDQALGVVAGMNVNVCLKRQMKEWSDQVAKGQDLAPAARAAHLPPLLTGVLATGQAGADLSAMFSFLARHYESRFSRALALLRGAVVPAVVLLVGALVCGIVVSMFLPLVSLIRHLSSGVWGLP